LFGVEDVGEQDQFLGPCIPTIRGRSQDPPKSTESPRRAKISENLERSVATTRSQARARFSPAPVATPSTRAMVGLASRCNARAALPTSRMCSRECWASGSRPPRSAPEQNAPPAPVSTSTRSAELLATSLNSFAIRGHMSRVTALRRFGRLRVTVTTP